MNLKHTGNWSTARQTFKEQMLHNTFKGHKFYKFTSTMGLKFSWERSCTLLTTLFDLPVELIRNVPPAHVTRTQGKIAAGCFQLLLISADNAALLRYSHMRCKTFQIQSILSVSIVTYQLMQQDQYHGGKYCQILKSAAHSVL